MEKQITCSKHSIEEYIKDNPKNKTPEKSLIFFFIEMLKESKKGNARFHIYNDRNASIIRYKDQAIVYNNYHIITYYRIIHSSLSNVKNQTLKKIDMIFSWEAKEKHDKFIENYYETIKRRNKKRNKKRYEKDLKKFNKLNKTSNHLSKCFNTR